MTTNIFTRLYAATFFLNQWAVYSFVYRKKRINIAKAFVAKSVYKFETTDILIEYLKGCKNIRRLCGWEMQGEIPSSATFSRAFSEFAKHGLPQKVHEAMVKKHCGPKLAGHISRDSTAIESREKPIKNKAHPTF